MLGAIGLRKDVIFITGCARSGTSLLTYLMKGFKDLCVIDWEEVPPHKISELPFEGWPLVIKYPQGRVDPDWDFDTPSWSLVHSKELRHYAKRWKILLCVRDARDSLTSRHPKKPDSYYVHSERWVKSVRRAAALKDHPNIHIVKYEHLALHTAQEMSSIAEFLGRLYSFSWLEDFHEHVRPDTQMAEALGSIRPIDTESIGRWRDPEHKDRISQIYDRWGSEIIPLLRTFGYEDADDWSVNRLCEKAPNSESLRS